MLVNNIYIYKIMTNIIIKYILCIILSKVAYSFCNKDKLFYNTEKILCSIPRINVISCDIMVKLHIKTMKSHIKILNKAKYINIVGGALHPRTFFCLNELGIDIKKICIYDMNKHNILLAKQILKKDTKHKYSMPKFKCKKINYKNIELSENNTLFIIPLTCRYLLKGINTSLQCRIIFYSYVKYDDLFNTKGLFVLPNKYLHIN
jgi:hypothetical protein